VDLFGTVETISVSSRRKSIDTNEVKPQQETSYLGWDDREEEEKKPSRSISFDERHGKQIELSELKQTAKRKSGFNHGIAISNHSLIPGKLFQVTSNNWIRRYI